MSESNLKIVSGLLELSKNQIEYNLHQENCHTKKSAIYHCIKNRFEVENGIIK